MVRGTSRVLASLYPDGSFRSIVTLSSGSVLGQVVLMASSPIISRLYDPGEFGLFSIFFSAFGILSIIATLQFQNAIPLPDRDTVGARLLVGSIAVLLVFSALLWVLILLFGDDLERFEVVSEGPALLQFLPLAIAIANANLCLQFWALRKKEYGALAVVKGLQSVAMSAGQIGLGFAGLGPAGLIVGHMLGQAAGIVHLTRGVISRHSAAFSKIQMDEVGKLLWKDRSFVTTFTPSALLGAGTIYLPAIFLGYVYGSEVAGVFAFALQLSKAGINLVVQAVSRVFLVSSIEKYNTGAIDRIKHKALRLALAQFLLGLPVFVALALYGEEIFGFVFGETWALGGIYVALLIPHLMTNFIFEHLAVLFVVTANHKAKLVWDVLKFLAMVVTFVSAKLAGWSPEACILILSLAWGVLHVTLVPITFRSLDRPDNSLKSSGDIG